MNQLNSRKKEVVSFILAGVVGTAVVLGLTIAIYATFFQDFLEQFVELTPDVVKMISRTNVNIGTMIMSNIAHGFLIATVIRWGKFYQPLKGAAAAGVIAFLTEIYFCFSQYSILKTMSLVTAIADTCMWTFINLFVGATVAYVFGKFSKKKK